MSDSSPFAGLGDYTLTRVVAAVIERDGRLLVCQRPVQKRHGGLWEFPGGKVQPGEDLFAAAARELGEELGVVVEHVGRTLYARQDPGSPFLIEFVEVAIAGEPRALEHDAVGWFGPSELPSLALAPTDRIFADRLVGGL